jgi:hypothetical protein
MLIIAKIVLGMASTVALATVYTFREGVIRVDVDEYREGGSHVHFFVPAAAVPMAVHFAPQRHKEHAEERLQEWMPMLRQLSKELEKYPDTEFVDVQDEAEHISVRTGESVHVACPLATIEDLAEEFAASRPGA